MSQTSNQATIFTKGIRGLFLRSLNGMTGGTLVNEVATLAPSNSDSEKYGWLGQPPQMQRVDPNGADSSSSAQPVPDFKALSDTSYTITNHRYSAAMMVNADDMADDQLGGLDIRVRQLVQVGLGHRDKLITDLIEGNGNCYDGSAFFGDSHPVRKDEGGTQDNNLAASGQTTANYQSDIASGISAMAGFTAENGEPFHQMMPSEFVLMAHPSQFANIEEAVRANLVSNTSNVRFSGFNIRTMYNARLSSNTTWYLFHVGGIVRPFIFQDREPLRLESVTDGERAVLQRQYIYQATARYNAGFGFWQDAVKFS